MMSYIVVIVVSVLLGILFDRKICKKAINSIENERNKYICLFMVLELWLANKHNGIELETYLQKMGYQKVAIYGMSVLGNLLYQELKDTDIKVSYAIDKNADNMYFGLPVIKPSEECGEVDAIIVTAILEYDRIRAALQKQTNIKIISLEDIVFDAAEM